MTIINKLSSNKKVKDLTGKVFDKLHVDSFKEVKKLNNNSVSIWNCTCACGKKVEKRVTYLTRGIFKSCGCYKTNGIKKAGSTLLWGFGVNDLQTPTQKEERIKGKRKVIWVCPYYQKWSSMIRRCYSEVLHKNNPSYIKCTVCEDWRYFSNFKSWMETQDWEGKHLDKDLLVSGNKEYAPDKCLFISRDVNIFMTSSAASRGEYPLGVYKKGKIFRAQCNNPYTKKQEILGEFGCPLKAHEVWKDKKLYWAISLSSLPENKGIGNKLIDRYTFEKGVLCKY